ncbi:MAG: glutathione synthase [Gemmatimonadetes bacterium]|nr:glutathione synthase [Gemmatimonadota bacterium]
MRLAFFINDLASELVVYTTTLLARAALRRGHDVWYVDVDGFSYEADGILRVCAHAAPGRGYKSDETFLAAVRGEDAVVEWLDTASLDALLLRNDPAADTEKRPWAPNVGILFGQMAAREGVLVLNDPEGLWGALNKMYLQRFPEEVRPRSLITRSPEKLREFVKGEAGGAVLKPLHGSGGQDVFLVREDDHPNLNQIIEAVSRKGYILAQEFLPAATERDVRLFLLNGRPLEVDGKVAAFSRLGSDGDLRTNMSAGGSAEPAKVTARMLELAELVRPQLVKDGMFLVGLDIAGDKLMEINVFSPGGLRSASAFEGVDFAQPVLDAVEAKVEHRRHYGSKVRNRELATL